MSTVDSLVVFEDHLSVADLTGFARALMDENYQNDSLLQMAPNQNINDLDYRFERGGAALQEMATHKSYDTPPKLVNRGQSGARVRGELPPIGEEERLGEYKYLKMRNAENHEFQAEITAQAANLVGRVGRKMQYLVGRMLQDGSYVIEENGLTADIDFQRDPSLTFAAAKPWTDPTADIPAQIGDLDQRIIDAGGTGIEELVMSREKWSQMQTHDSMRNAFVTTANAPIRLDREQLQGIITNLLGRPVTILVNDRQFDARNDQGAMTKVRAIDADRVIAKASGPIGRTLFGRTAEADFLNLTGQTPEGIVVYPEVRMKPVNHYVAMAAIGAPIYGDRMANTTASMQV